ncbi:hypothetical protein CAPTEDRAFT_3766 [Capitella teleta]|uniref:Gamma-glutamyltranspeptidase 1 n=1 Tax=Capitella teleta TaxID=283909 RepID=R7UTJ7_CAPTE|nr:hypothetical protein CAPTEDRAFT_3766 [Capitella teleta]|eukprot:ELU09505.1 hypothetical protein CAPTEDRAFT_3766 [Capitella teleta]
MGTSHMNVYGADGSAASLTSTINYWFGSKVRGNRTGIMFNNEMDDFSSPGTSNVYGFPASPSNYIVPGKMPLSSMSPSLVFNQHGDAELLAGASGGSKIISATAQVIMNNLWFKMSPIASADQPRLHHQLVRDIIYYEPSFEKAILDGLREKEHTVQEMIGYAEFLKIPMEDLFCLQAVADGRKGGSPDGI